MDNRRRRSQAFAYFLTIVAALLFSAILAALTLIADLSAEARTAMVQWGTAIVALLTMAAAYEFGSSKGSAMKDEMAARSPEQPPEPKPGDKA